MSVSAGTSCQVTNLMPDYWRAMAQPNAAAQLRATLVVAHSDLYNDNYVKLPVDDKWEALVGQSLP